MSRIFLTTLFAMLIMVNALAQEDKSSRPVQQKGTIIAADNSNIQYVGRINYKNPKAPCFTFPGIQINAQFTGSSLKMMAKPMSGFFMVSIDGNEAFKVGFNSQRDSVITIATALSPQQVHSARIMYVTEGYERRAEFRGFIIDEGATLLNPQPLPKRRIEFIGNSITCGYGVEDTNCWAPFQDETCNHYYTYAAITTRNLNAVHQTVARSGIGVYRCYDGPVTGDSINMNTEYPYTLLYDHSQAWDFTTFIPHLVCINLGTNDTSTKGADPTLLRNGYRNLIAQVRSHYPDAKIVMLCGCMMSGDQLKQAQQALDDVVKELNRKGDRNIYRFDFTPQDGSMGYGADWHPSMQQQSHMADELTPYLRKLMNW